MEGRTRGREEEKRGMKRGGEGGKFGGIAPWLLGIDAPDHIGISK